MNSDAGAFFAGLAALAAAGFAGAGGRWRRLRAGHRRDRESRRERQRAPDATVCSHCRLRRDGNVPARHQGIIPHSNILLTMGAETLLKNAWRICGSPLQHLDRPLLHLRLRLALALRLFLPQLLAGRGLVLLDHLVGDHVHDRELRVGDAGGDQCSGCDEQPRFVFIRTPRMMVVTPCAEAMVVRAHGRPCGREICTDARLRHASMLRTERSLLGLQVAVGAARAVVGVAEVVLRDVRGAGLVRGEDQVLLEHHRPELPARRKLQAAAEGGDLTRSSDPER